MTKKIRIKTGRAITDFQNWSAYLKGKGVRCELVDEKEVGQMEKKL